MPTVNIKAFSHKKSTVIENGGPKLPTAAQLELGEIAMNFAKGYETLSIKNNNDEIVTFTNDNYWINKELAIAAALNDLNDRKQDALEMDEIPTEGSENIVTSGGLYSYITEIEQVTAAALNDLNDKVTSLALSDDYTAAAQGTPPLAGDTYETAISKLHKVIVDDELITSSALNDLNSRIDNLSLSEDYEATNIGYEPESGDTYEAAISKLHGAILENELTTSAALNDLNTRINTTSTALSDLNTRVSDIVVPEVVLSEDYEPSSLSNQDLFLAPGDSYETAFSKLEKTINDNENITSAALTDLDSRLNLLHLPQSLDDIPDGSTRKIVTVDSVLNSNSENPVQNKVIDDALTEIKTDYVKKVLATKSYTNIIGTADSFDGATFFFATVVPTGWKDFWHIKYRIRAHIQGRSTNDGEEWSEVEICGSAATMYWSRSYNAIQTTSVRPYYYHYLYRLTQTGFNTDYGHLIGIGLQSSYYPTNTTYKRDFTIELLETDNCTFTFMDNMTLYSNITGHGSTNYTGSNAIDGTTQGVTVTGDRNTVSTFQLNGGCWVTAGINGIFGYTIIMADSSGTYQSTVLSYSNETNKSKNSVGFDLTKPIYWYYTSTSIAAGNHTTSSVNLGYPGDIRYSCNCGSTLTQGNPFYLVMTQGNDGLFYLEDIWWTQTLPSTNDGKYYVYIGIAYSTYTVHMEIEKPIYYHNGTKIVRYIPDIPVITLRQW